MLKGFILFASLFVATLQSQALETYPKGPDQNLTPGALCQHADQLRYPEKIKYCERDVSSQEKAQIFVSYDQIGYRTRSLKRQAFKIDHYIPLCAGGSNSEENLWPQHESVYNITDPLEALVCEKMSAGRLLQKDAIELIKEAKNNLDMVPAIIAKVQKL